MVRKRKGPGRTGYQGYYGNGGTSKWARRVMLQLAVCILIVLAVIVIKKMDIAIANRALETFHAQMTTDVSGNDLASSAKSVFAQIKVLPAAVEDSSFGTGKKLSFSPPANEAAAVSTFGEQEGYYGKSETGFERGMKFYSQEELQVYAVGGGTVAEVSESSEYGGTLVKITHGNEIVSLYGGCTKVYVKPLEKVKKGQLIASVSPEGDNGLRFELWVNGKIVNPADYIAF